MKPRILVVDDEESIREFLEIMLNKEGYETSLAEDGSGHWRFFKRKPLILLFQIYKCLI